MLMVNYHFGGILRSQQPLIVKEYNRINTYPRMKHCKIEEYSTFFIFKWKGTQLGNSFKRGKSFIYNNCDGTITFSELGFDIMRFTIT